MNIRVRVGLVVTTLVTIAPTTAVVGPAAGAEEHAPAHRSAPLTLQSPASTTISPNGDGVRDAAVIRYRLRHSAAVRVVITGSAGVLEVRRLGRQSAGAHVLRWGGAQPGVGRLPDGVYDLRLRTPGKAGASTAVTIDTQAPDLAFARNRLVVYPATTLFADQIRLFFASDIAQHLSATVRRTDGAVVQTLTPQRIACNQEAGIDDGACAALSWDGRARSGQIAPVGTYRLRLVARDGHGNVSVSESGVTVSAQPLVERTQTVTYAAARLPHVHSDCPPFGANGCELSTTDPVASTRFPDGGLSFAHPIGSQQVVANYHTGFYSETGHERYQITATGGPADGTNGSAVLSAGGHEVTMQGDGSFALPELTVTRAPEAVTGHPAWAVSAATAAAYDVASFTITYVDFAPAVG